MRRAPFDLNNTLLDGDSDKLWREFLLRHGELARAESRPTSLARRYRAGQVSAAALCAIHASTLAGAHPRNGSRGANDPCAT